jgi:hypothetical protein
VNGWMWEIRPGGIGVTRAAQKGVGMVWSERSRFRPCSVCSSSRSPFPIVCLV